MDEGCRASEVVLERPRKVDELATLEEDGLTCAVDGGPVREFRPLLDVVCGDLERSEKLVMEKWTSERGSPWAEASLSRMIAGSFTRPRLLRRSDAAD